MRLFEAGRYPFFAAHHSLDAQPVFIQPLLDPLDPAVQRRDAWLFSRLL